MLFSHADTRPLGRSLFTVTTPSGIKGPQMQHSGLILFLFLKSDYYAHKASRRQPPARQANTKVTLLCVSSLRAQDAERRVWNFWLAEEAR